MLGTPPALILSQDQTLKLKWSSAAVRRSAKGAKADARQSIPFNVDRLLIGSLTLFSSSSVWMVRSRLPVVNYTHDSRIALRHPLILDGFSAFALPCADAPGWDSGGPKCLHVLSSFQRTGRAFPAASILVGGTFQSY